MDEIENLLEQTGFRFTTSLDDETVLYPGPLRFSVLEHAALRMLGPDASELLGLNQEQPAEEARVERLHECFSLLGVPSDPEDVRGNGTRTDRLAYLSRVLRLARTSAELQDPRAEADASSSSSAVLTAAAGMQGALLSSEVTLLPPDVKQAAENYSGEALDRDGLRDMAAKAQREAQELEEYLAAEDDDHTPGAPAKGAASGPQGQAAWAEAERELRSNLADFHDAARDFTDLFAKDLASWADAIPKPELHGIGPAATRTLRKYRLLRKALDGVRTIRQAHGSIAADLGPEQQPWLAALHRQVAESAELLLAQADAHDTAAAAEAPCRGREALLLASTVSPAPPAAFPCPS